MNPPPSRGQLRGIDHVVVAAPACPKGETEHLADAFYGEVLGLRRVPGPEDATEWWYAAPGVTIRLRVVDPFVPAPRAGPTLVVDDLDALTGRAATAGGTVDLQPAADADRSPRRARVEDPFGNGLELVEMVGPTPEMFQVMADRSIYPISMIDEQGVIRWASASFEGFFGRRAEELVGTNFTSVIAPGAVAATVQAFVNLDQVTEPTPWGGVAFPTELLHADGSTVACEAAALPTQRSGLPWQVVISRQAGYERTLDHAIEAMAEGAGLGELLALVVTAIEEIMPQAASSIGHRWDGDRFGVTAGAAAPMLVTHPGAPWARALTTGEPQYVGSRKELPGPLAALAAADGYEACWVHPIVVGTDLAPSAAVVVWRHVAGWPTPFMEDNLHRACQLLRLTLQWDRSHRALEFAATHDPLTGLVNRQTFHDRLGAVIDAGAGHAAVLYLDLDHFKPVNDRLGHLIGDRALAVVAERLVGALRPGDLVARIGGDEFAVLCERLSSPEAAEHVATRLLEAIRRPILELAPQSIHLDASIGVADVGGEEQVDVVLARADEAMRSAKRGGRGRWLRRRD